MLTASSPPSLRVPSAEATGARIRYDALRARSLRYRRFHRANLRITVLTVIGSHLATVTGISLFGAVLHGGRRLRRHEIVALKLPSGQRITGRVRWRLGARAGVTFRSPVADFARLIGEGALVSTGRRRPARADRARALLAADISLAHDAAAITRLGLAVAKAWRVIEQAISARMVKRKSNVRRFD